MYTYTDIYSDIYSTTSPIIMIFGLSKFALSIRVLENVNFNFDYITRDGSEKVKNDLKLLILQPTFMVFCTQLNSGSLSEIFQIF